MSQTYMQGLISQRQSTTTPPPSNYPGGPAAPGGSKGPSGPGARPPIANPPSVKPGQGAPGAGRKDYILEPISRGNYLKEGYNIKVNYTPRVGETILLLVDGVAFDITHGFTYACFRSLLAYFIARKIFSIHSTRYVEATAVVCTKSTSGGTAKYVFMPGSLSPVPMHFEMGLTSQVRYIPAPVEPLPISIPRGAAALAPIGQSTPKLLYVTEGSSYAGRMLYEFMGYNWFVYNSMFECDPAKRGLDCTTYILSCYRRITGVNDGVDLVGKLKAGKPVLDTSDGATTRQYLADNPGSYIVLVFETATSATTCHVLGYTGGQFHEFTNAAPAGYHCTSRAGRTLNKWYRIYTMP